MSSGVEHLFSINNSLVIIYIKKHNSNDNKNKQEPINNYTSKYNKDLI